MYLEKAESSTQVVWKCDIDIDKVYLFLIEKTESTAHQMNKKSKYATFKESCIIFDSVFIKKT